MRCTFVAAVAVLAFASTTNAAPITAADTAQFKIGVSTLSEVETKLGRPQSVATAADGTTIAYVSTTMHVKAATYLPVIGMFAGGSKTQASMVTFVFTPGGVLKSTSTSDQSMDCSAMGSCK